MRGPGLFSWFSAMLSTSRAALDGSERVWHIPILEPFVCFRQVTLPGGKKVRLAAAGADFSCAVDEEGGVWTWGKADRGRLGHSTPLAKGEAREKMVRASALQGPHLRPSYRQSACSSSTGSLSVLCTMRLGSCQMPWRCAATGLAAIVACTWCFSLC